LDAAETSRRTTALGFGIYLDRSIDVGQLLTSLLVSAGVPVYKVVKQLGNKAQVMGTITSILHRWMKKLTEHSSRYASNKKCSALESEFPKKPVGQDLFL